MNASGGQPLRLWVIYDPHCAFCRHCRRWLEGQAAYVAFTFVASDAPSLVDNYPKLAHCGELIVVCDRGNVYRGPDAFIACLWALVEYRAWALRFASPQWKSMGRTFFEFVSKNRGAASAFLDRRLPMEQIAQKITHRGDECQRCASPQAPFPQKRS